MIKHFSSDYWLPAIPHKTIYDLHFLVFTQFCNQGLLTWILFCFLLWQNYCHLKSSMFIYCSSYISVTYSQPNVHSFACHRCENTEVVLSFLACVLNRTEQSPLWMVAICINNVLSNLFIKYTSGSRKKCLL